MASGYTGKEEPVHSEISSSTEHPGAWQALHLSASLLSSQAWWLRDSRDRDTLGTLWGKEIALVPCILVTQTPGLGLGSSTYPVDLSQEATGVPAGFAPWSARSSCRHLCPAICLRPICLPLGRLGVPEPSSLLAICWECGHLGNLEVGLHFMLLSEQPAQGWLGVSSYLGPG